jgi:hAT family C-terminal dimerisation region
MALLQAVKGPGCSQLNKFICYSNDQKDANTFSYQMLTGGVKSPLEFWKSTGRKWPDLQKIAVKLFSMATSSASSERNFSTMKFIHSKERNSLGKETVEKLVFIKSNSAAFSSGGVINFDDDDDESASSDSN